MPSIKRNIIANYASQIYITIITIIMTPMYVRYLGIESYGLVGFFTMLQAWFQLLDIGLSPTMARQTAQFRGGTLSGFNLRCLLRALEYFFIGMACLGGGSLLISSGYIAHHWLKVESISLGDVQSCIQLMAIIVALRWVCSLYRGVVTGFEQFVWLSRFNIIFATGKFALVILIFVFVSKTIIAFFLYQLALAIIELFTLISFSYKLLPSIKPDETVRWQWNILRGVLKFSLSIAFTSMIWILITQADKLILSKILGLADYGYYTLAVLVAAGINAMTSPISMALLPRLAKLSSEKKEHDLVQLYRRSTQLLCVVAVPVTLIIALFSEQVLFAWVGDTFLASKVSQILTFYALGNGMLAIVALPYYLQYAKGDLRLHIIGNSLFIILFIPVLILTTLQFGMLGAGYSWVGLNVIYFLIWIPLVHHRFIPGLHVKWLMQDVIVIIMPAVIVGLLIKKYFFWPIERMPVALQLIAIALLLMVVTAMQSPFVRHFIGLKWPQSRIFKERS